jgi:hypothetical protein
MGLRLHTVTPRQGWRWFVDGLRLYFRKPLVFTGLFLMFLLGVLIVMGIPYVGGLVGLGLMPLLTYGFMAASRDAQAGEPVLPMQVFDAFGGSAAQRRAMLVLCALYALGSVGTLELAHWVDDGSFERLQQAMAGGEAKAAEMAAELTNPALLYGMLVRFGVASLLSVPFWFAPGLVRWGDQNAWQALFSSTLALWQAKGAFVVYSLAWTGAVMAVATVAGLLAAGLGLRQLAGMLVAPIGLVFSVAFYVSLWFSWRDCFGDGAPPPDPMPTQSA